MRRAPIVLAVLFLAACGAEPAVEVSTTLASSTTTDASSTTVPEPTTTTSVPLAPSTTTAAATTTTASGMPGTPIDFGPAQGDILMVRGVAHDDVLNLRAAPGASQQILDTIEPTYMDLRALGQTRELPGAFWIKVEHGNTAGWVHMGFVGYAGGVEDITAEVIDDMGGTPSAATMTQLATLVAESLASEEVESEIVQVTPVKPGAIHEVSFDVIGFADDALVGVRIHVFGQPGGPGFTLKSVEMMAICGRGVDDGACV